MRRILLLPILAPLTVTLMACDGETILRMPREAPPAAALVAPIETEPLEEQLRGLESEIQRAREGEPERLLTAEAISDQLIHAERSVDWLGTGYSVEARLRQLQTMADRIVALLRRGSSVESVDEDVVVLLTAVQDLRERLSRGGGGAAPPSLEELLQQDPLRDVEAASLQGMDGSGSLDDPSDVEPRVQPVPSGPLGTPVRAPDTIPGG